MGNHLLLPCAQGLPTIPFPGAAFEAEQTGQATKAWLKQTPDRARESTWGVSMPGVPTYPICAP